jgi:hypothetical protein
LLGRDKDVLCLEYVEPIGDSADLLVIVQMVTSQAFTDFSCLALDALASEVYLFLSPDKQMKILSRILVPRLEKIDTRVFQTSLSDVIQSVTQAAVRAEIKSMRRTAGAMPAKNPLITDTRPASDGDMAKQRDLLEKKVTFAEDVVATVHNCSVFVTNTVPIKFAPQENSFEGFKELKEMLIEKLNNDAVAGGHQRKAQQHKRRKSGRCKRGKGRLTKDVEPVTKNFGEQDVFFFMFFVPYVIPCSLMIRMIREEQAMAREQ